MTDMQKEYSKAQDKRIKAWANYDKSLSSGDKGTIEKAKAAYEKANQHYHDVLTQCYADK